MTVKGSVPGSCGVDALTAFSTATLTAAGAVTATAAVKCNTAFVLRARSERGAMETAATGSAPFARRVPYDLAVSVPLDSGATAAATCASGALVSGATACALSPAGTGLSSGSATAIAAVAQLRVSWAAPGATPLLQGSYTDRLTLTVTAQP